MNIFRQHQPVTMLGEPGEAFASTIYSVLTVASIAVSAYHGGKRNGGSIGWTIGWGLLGGLFPVITPTVAAVQGYARCKYNCSRR